MPSAGLIHFYQYDCVPEKVVFYVSMPSEGLIHFYFDGCQEWKDISYSGVNALGGLNSFLRILSGKDRTYPVVCQCPRRA